MSVSIRLRGALLAVAVAGALGFGGAQAVATPSQGEPAARRCTQDACNNHCMIKYGVPGFCDGRGCWCGG